MAEKPVQTFPTPEAAKQYAHVVAASKGASIGPKTGVSLAPSKYIEEGILEVGRRAKEKNQQYSGFSDKELGSRLVQKYPQYAAFAESYDPYAKKTTIAEAGGGVGGFFRAAGANVAPEIKNVAIYGKRLATGRENVVADAAGIAGGIAKQAGTPIQIAPTGSEAGAAADFGAKLQEVGGALAESVASSPVSTALSAGATAPGRAALGATASAAGKAGSAGLRLAQEAAPAVAAAGKKAAQIGKKVASVPGKAVSETTKYAIS